MGKRRQGRTSAPSSRRLAAGAEAARKLVNPSYREALIASESDEYHLLICEMQDELSGVFERVDDVGGRANIVVRIADASMMTLRVEPTQHEAGETVMKADQTLGRLIVLLLESEDRTLHVRINGRAEAELRVA